MSIETKTKIFDIYVRVDHDRWHLDRRGEGYGDYDIQEAKEIIAQIKRHVDGWSFVDCVVDRREVCPWCEEEWEEEPACCQEAVDAWEREQQIGGE